MERHHSCIDGTKRLMARLALIAFLICLQKFSGSLTFSHGFPFLQSSTSRVKINDAVLLRRRNCYNHLARKSLPPCREERTQIRSTSSSEVDVLELQRTKSNYTAVKRNYESYLWKDKYNINYRVEGPIGGRPILLVHGFGANVVSDLSFELDNAVCRFFLLPSLCMLNVL